MHCTFAYFLTVVNEEAAQPRITATFNKATLVSILLFISHGSPTYSMKVVTSTQQTATPSETVQSDTSPILSPLPKLPWNVIMLIFKEYFYTLGLHDSLAIKDGLGTLIEACCTNTQRSTIFALLELIYGSKNITKLVLACEICKRPGVYEWISEYQHLNKELLVACAGTTPLISALRSPSVATATFLLGVSPKASTLRSDNGCTPLIAAAEENNCVAISQLLATGVTVNATDNEGYTALHRAVEKGNYEATDVLLAAQANPDVCTQKRGFTPLYIAFLLKNEPLVRLLLLHKANPNIKTKESITPLMHILYQYHYLKNEAEEGYEEQLATLEMLLKHLLQTQMLKVNQLGPYGTSPLGKALECGLSAEIIKALTAKQAQLSAKELRQSKKTKPYRSKK